MNVKISKYLYHMIGLTLFPALSDQNLNRSDEVLNKSSGSSFV